MKSHTGLKAVVMAASIVAYGCSSNGETNPNTGGQAGEAGTGGSSGQGGSSGGAGGDGGSALEVSINDCSQDSTYLNKMNCSAVVTNGDGSETCQWQYNGADVSGLTSCDSTTFDNFEPGVANTYKIVVNSEAEDSMQKSADYEKPLIGICVTSGSPGSYIGVNCARDPPTQPDGNDTLFVVVDHNLPPAAGNFIVSDQPTGAFNSENPSPPSTDMSSLFLTTKLCVDYDNTGDIESQENNCDEKTINDF